MKLGKVSIAVALSVSLAACGVVDTGNRGVFVNLGEPVSQVSEGLHWYNPLTTDLIEINVRQQKMNAETQAYTKDVQQAKIKYTVIYSLEPSKAMKMYQTVGLDWAKTLIPQVVEQSIKVVMGRSEAVKDTINNRGAVQMAVLAELKSKLAAQGIIVHSFELRDIEFSKAFEKAVEAKQVAVENANASRNKTVQIEEEAKQKVISANADAEAMAIKTKALAGNSELVQYEAVRKWDGKLPQNMYGGGAIPFIQAGK